MSASTAASRAVLSSDSGRGSSLLLRGDHQAAAHAAVAVERCVQVQLAPVQVPGTRRERHRGRELALRALADHVDGGRRHAHTGLDAVGAAHDVDAFVQGSVEFLVGAAAVAGQAVGLEVGDLEAARVVQRALRVIKLTAMPFTLRSTASMLVSDWRSICARVTVLVDCGVSRGVRGRRVEALSRAPEMVMLPSALGSCTNSSGR